MPKKSDQLAGGFDPENTGGLLTGLLAEEENIDRRAMLRLGTWGVVSVGAVIVAVLANQSAIRTRRDEVAALDLTRQSVQISAIAKDSQNEARRLASAIDTLNNDRDRLYTRLAGVEQGLESVTGAIAKQKAGAAPSSSAAMSALPSFVPSPAASQPALPPAVAHNEPIEPAPMVGPVTTTAAAAAAAEKARAEARKPAAPAAAMAAIAPVPAPVPAPATTSAMPVVPRTAIAPPDPATAKLVEPVPSAKSLFAAPTPPPPATVQVPAATTQPGPQVATTSPVPDKSAGLEKGAPAAAVPASAPIEVKHTEFGVDVGGANSVAGLRALWRGLLRYRSNAPLAALQPIIVVKEANNGLGMQLRLVAGPLSDAAAAAKICATIGSKDRGCETTVYDGQRLAVKADDLPASTEGSPAKPALEKPPGDRSSADRPDANRAGTDKPASDREVVQSAPEKPVARPGSNKYFHRRSSFVPVKRTAAVAPPPAPVTEEPPKPEPSGLSTLFNRVHPQPQQ